MTLEAMKEMYSMLNPDTKEGYALFKDILEVMFKLPDEEAVQVLRELKAISKEKLKKLVDHDPVYFGGNVAARYAKFLNIDIGQNS